jgi:hypothetical protein
VAQDGFVPGTNFSAWIHQRRAQPSRVHRHGLGAGSCGAAGARGSSGVA